MFSHGFFSTRQPTRSAPTLYTDFPTGIHLQLAGKEDVLAIAAIAKKTYREFYSPYYNSTDMDQLLKDRFGETFVQKTYFDELRSQQAKYYLINEDSTTVGYAKLTIIADDKAKLDKIYLLKSHQRKGIGKAIVQQFFGEALAANKNMMDLVVDDYNKGAIAFYTDQGFVDAHENFTPAIPNSTSTPLVNLIMRCDNIAKHYRPINHASAAASFSR